METIESKIVEISTKWLDIISDPIILAPLIFGLGIGYVVSLSPWVRDKRRASDRAFYVYLTNVLSASTVFVLTNLEHDVDAILTMLVLVAGSSIGIPWFYFNIYRKKDEPVCTSELIDEDITEKFHKIQKQDESDKTTYWKE